MFQNFFTLDENFNEIIKNALNGKEVKYEKNILYD